jgi:hypothetical protein
MLGLAGMAFELEADTEDLAALEIQHLALGRGQILARGWSLNGAEGETRTPTPVKGLDPESSASTKFRHFGIRGGVTLAITPEECQAAPLRGAVGSGRHKVERG